MKSKHFAKAMGVLAMSAVAIALIAPVAGAATPAPGYSRFAGCPTVAEHAETEI